MVYHYFTGLSPNSSKIYCKILQARYYFLTLFKLPSGSTLLGALGALGYLWIGFLYPQHNSARKNGAGTFISILRMRMTRPRALARLALVNDSARRGALGAPLVSNFSWCTLLPLDWW